MASILRPLLLALGLTGLLVTVGIVLVGADDGGPDPQTAASATPIPTRAVSSTPLAELETDRLVVRRRPFCPLVPETAVATALGAEAAAVTVYGNGEALTVAGETDVAHEEGCRWESAAGALAAAWVFAPPVTVRSARGLVRSVLAARGCTRTDAPAYGAPSVALVCRTGRTSTASLRGLFGDAWLTCTLSGPASDPSLEDRTRQWCADVAVAASRS